MTVNEYKETTCATAGQVEDMEIEENMVPVHQQPSQEGENENLLGRVLAGNSLTSYFITMQFTKELHQTLAIALFLQTEWKDLGKCAAVSSSFSRSLHRRQAAGLAGGSTGCHNDE
ncbi:hypothetical protein JTB14_027659 [Gonioctena quinquepunctata]|nr:hypothetical protein JTB14_027659 [Gonioctena quinquepunctata]